MSPSPSLILSYPIPSYPILSYPILILSYPILSYRIQIQIQLVAREANGCVWANGLGERLRLGERSGSMAGPYSIYFPPPLPRKTIVLIKSPALAGPYFNLDLHAYGLFKPY